MESLLHWAIENSDPAVLADRAGRKDKGQEEVVKDFLERKQRVKVLYDAVNALPTEAGLMKQAIAGLQDGAAAPEARLAALEELQRLVEPIDNANDLHTLGGLAPVVALLAEPHPTPIRAAAAHVIGTAASNNLKFIRQLVSLHPRIPHALLAITQLRDDAAAAKGLYALGTVVRGSREARAAFYAASGLSQLEAAAAPGAAQSERVRTKALHLLTDLLELTTFDEGGGSDASQQQQQQQQQEDGRGNAEIERLAAGVLPQFAGAALQLLQTAESLRAQETALLALHTILAKRPQDGREALEAMGAEGVLREALVALEAALLTGEDAAEEARREAAGLKPREGGGGEQSAGEDQGEDPGEFGDGSDPSYRHYLVGLCADLLQDLSAEQGFLGHDEL